MQLRSLCVAAVLALAAPSVALADSFTVHSYDLGDQPVSWSHATGGSGSNYAPLFDVTLDGVDGISFCVDLFQYIGRSTYSGTVSDPAAISEPGLDYAGAAEIANAWGHNLDDLQAATGATYRQAITGVQVGIWQTLYGDDLTVSGLSSGSTDVLDYVLGQQYSGYGGAVIIRFPNNQDQVFVPTNPVPEPGTWALLALGGLALFGGARRRK